LIAAAVAGLLAGVGAAAGASANEEGAGGSATAPCYGINKCQGTGDCGGKGHSCHGSNACKGQGFIELSQDDCLRIEGGRLTPDPAS
jgi:uncharacterized membrane protein